MITKYKLTAALVFGLSALGFAQGSTPDFNFKLGKTRYLMNLSKGNAKAQNDTVFYNLYRWGSTKRIGKEIKQIVNRSSGDTVKRGSFELSVNRISFYQREKNKPTMLRVYKQNENGLVSVKSSILALTASTAKSANQPSTAAVPASGYPKQVDIPAEFPGGINKARQFIADNLKYPAKAMANDIEGTVTTKFTIEVDGTLSNIQILKKLGYGCDEEVIRVLKGMPKWNPAREKGKTVKSYFTMPVNFKFQ